MAKMTFGVNLLPKNDGNTYSLGNSSQKWKIYVTEINGIDISSNTLLTNNDINLTSVEANKVFAGPTNGNNIAPSFRSLVAADIPDLSGTYKTSSGVTGISWNSSNKKIQQSVDNGTATDVLEFEAGSNVTLTPTNGKLTIAATDTTYSNETAVNNGTDLSLVTTGEKYNWNNKGEKMVILSYGSSTWQDFLNAYNNNIVVYCRASSNANPASGSQTRMAFMAYVNNATNPTKVEFQYYRSVSTHSASQQGDQVYVYTLDSSQGWSVITREAYSKVATGTGLQSSYSNSTITLSTTSLHLTKTGISSLPYTISNTNIKSSMVVVGYSVTPNAGDLTITTANGSVTISGELITGKTIDITLDLME